MGVRVGPSTTPPERSPDDETTTDGAALPDPTAFPLLPAPPAAPWFRRVDLLILPVVFLLDVLVFSSLLSDTSTAERIGIIAYSGLGVALLIFRRRAPILVFCAAFAHSMLALLSTVAYVPVLVLLVALEAVAEAKPPRVSVIALASVAAPTALLVAAAAREASPERQLTAAIGSAIFYCALGIGAWGIGLIVRRHTSRLSRLNEQHQREVDRERQEAEQAVSVERLRIARELHDIVAHSVTIMVLHAAGAKRVVDTDPARAKESLTTIEQSGQQAMGELRRLLQLLRENEGDPAGAGSPLPGLAELPQVVNSVRGSGVDVVLEVTGAPGRLDTSIELAAYRLVQEALTNVSKHRGAGTRAVVSIDWGAEKMTVSVEDDGAGADELSGGSLPAGSLSTGSLSTGSLSTGNGIVGLRERVAIAGGDFVAGPTESGGFRVAARLPVSTLSTAGAPVELPVQQVPHERIAPGSDLTSEAGFVRADP